MPQSTHRDIRICIAPHRLEKYSLLLMNPPEEDPLPFVPHDGDFLALCAWFRSKIIFNPFHVSEKYLDDMFRACEAVFRFIWWLSPRVQLTAHHLVIAAQLMYHSEFTLVISPAVIRKVINCSVYLDHEVSSVASLLNEFLDPDPVNSHPRRHFSMTPVKFAKMYCEEIRIHLYLYDASSVVAFHSRLRGFFLLQCFPTFQWHQYCALLRPTIQRADAHRYGYRNLLGPDKETVRRVVELNPEEFRRFEFLCRPVMQSDSDLYRNVYCTLAAITPAFLTLFHSPKVSLHLPTRLGYQTVKSSELLRDALPTTLPSPPSLSFMLPPTPPPPPPTPLPGAVGGKEESNVEQQQQFESPVRVTAPDVPFDGAIDDDAWSVASIEIQDIHWQDGPGAGVSARL
jgi:hypothetical protein